MAPPQETVLGISRDTILRLDAGAQAIRRELEQRHHQLGEVEIVNRKLAAHIGKYDGLFARLCIVWHCIEHAHQDRPPSVITSDVARRVAAFLHRFLLRHAIAFYASVLGLSDDHDQLTEVAAHILARRLDTLTLRDIQRGSRSMRAMTRDEARAVCERLEALGWLQASPALRNGSAPHWTVPEAVHSLFAERARTEKQRRRVIRKTVAEIAAGTGR